MTAEEKLEQQERQFREWGAMKLEHDQIFLTSKTPQELSERMQDFLKRMEVITNRHSIEDVLANQRYYVAIYSGVCS